MAKATYGRIKLLLISLYMATSHRNPQLSHCGHYRLKRFRFDVRRQRFKKVAARPKNSALELRRGNSKNYLL